MADFIAVAARRGEIAPGRVKVVEVNSHIALCNVDGEFFAINDVSPTTAAPSIRVSCTTTSSNAPSRRALRREDGQGAGPAGGQAGEHLRRPRGRRAIEVALP